MSPHCRRACQALAGTCAHCTHAAAPWWDPETHSQAGVQPPKGSPASDHQPVGDSRQRLDGGSCQALCPSKPFTGATPEQHGGAHSLLAPGTEERAGGRNSVSGPGTRPSRPPVTLSRPHTQPGSCPPGCRTPSSLAPVPGLSPGQPRGGGQLDQVVSGGATLGLMQATALRASNRPPNGCRACAPGNRHSDAFRCSSLGNHAAGGVAYGGLCGRGFSSLWSSHDFTMSKAPHTQRHEPQRC